MGAGFGWKSRVNELVLERKCVRGTMVWPPLEVPGRAPLDRLGRGTDCWEEGSGDAMTRRDLVDW